MNRCTQPFPAFGMLVNDAVMVAVISTITCNVGWWALSRLTYCQVLLWGLDDIGSAREPHELRSAVGHGIGYWFPWKERPLRRTCSLVAKEKETSKARQPTWHVSPAVSSSIGFVQWFWTPIHISINWGVCSNASTGAHPQTFRFCGLGWAPVICILNRHLRLSW